MFKKDDLGAEFKKCCFRNDLFFLFLKANTILFKGNLEGSRSLIRLTCGCFSIALQTIYTDVHNHLNLYMYQCYEGHIYNVTYHNLYFDCDLQQVLLMVDSHFFFLRFILCPLKGLI